MSNSKAIFLRLTPTTDAIVRKMADELDRPMAWIVRQAVINYAMAYQAGHELVLVREKDLREGNVDG